MSNITFDQALQYLEVAYDHLKYQGLVKLNPTSIRRALREIEAPFITETFVKRNFGVDWSVLKQWLLGQRPRPSFEGEGALDPGCDLLEDGSITIDPSEVANIDKDEVWERLKRRSHMIQERVETSAHRTATVTSDGPIGLVLVGDAHIGSACADYDRLDWVVNEVTESEHGKLYVLQVGDLLDSMIWSKVALIGRESGVDVPEELVAATHWLERLADSNKFMGMVAGNHDLISEKITGVGGLENVLLRLKSEIICEKHELTLTVLVGDQEYDIVLRHKVKGSSMWNPAQGPAKWLRMNGASDADMIITGHVHRSGYQSLVMGGRQRHAVQLGAYKISEADDFAREHGFDVTENQSPDMLAVLWPDERKIRVFEDTALGIEYLNLYYRDQSGELLD